MHATKYNYGVSEGEEATPHAAIRSRQRNSLVVILEIHYKTNAHKSIIPAPVTTAHTRYKPI
jgi:hypothetical protein